MARERCLVIDLSSHRSAQLLAIALREDGAADVDVEGGRIWWFLASVHRTLAPA